MGADERIPEPGEVEDPCLGLPGDAEPLPAGDADDDTELGSNDEEDEG